MTFTAHVVYQPCKEIIKDRRQASLQVFTRTDANAHNHAQSSDSAPRWGDAVRRLALDLDEDNLVEDVKVKDQPTG
eukprot:9482659-Pyramimonas_sp.AAC.1